MSELPKRKCPAFSIDDKLNQIKRLKSGDDIKNIAQDIGVHSATVRRWKRNAKTLEQFKKNNISKPKLRRIRGAANPQLEEALKIWYDECRRQGTPITGPLIKQKAMILNEKLGGSSQKFVASDGWLNRWKARNDIKSYTVSEEKLSADKGGAEKFKNKLLSMLQAENLQPCQIFNADETGLNFKMLPKKTLGSRSESEAAGLNLNKDRVTILACTNADGSCKLPLVVIEKSARPRALENHSKRSLPVMYTHQKKAWMNSSIFESWFMAEFVPHVTRFLLSKNLPLKALLLVDNAACHPKNLAVGDIKVAFLPSNTTSIIQPLDQGIIENMKKNYTHTFLSSILRAQELGETLEAYVKTVNIKHVIELISKAWDDISPETISECWKPLISEYITDVEMNRIEPFLQLLPLFYRIPDYKNISVEEVQSWINDVSNIEPAIISDNDIIEMVQPSENDENKESDNDNNKENDDDDDDEINTDDEDDDDDKSYNNSDFFRSFLQRSQQLQNEVSNEVKENKVGVSFGSNFSKESQVIGVDKLVINSHTISPNRAVNYIDSLIEFFECRSSLTPEETTLLRKIRYRAASLEC